MGAVGRHVNTQASVLTYHIIISTYLVLIWGLLADMLTHRHPYLLCRYVEPQQPPVELCADGRARLAHGQLSDALEYRLVHPELVSACARAAAAHCGFRQL